MIDLNALKAEADRLRAEGLGNRQITAKLAEIVSYRYRERPTQTLIMDVLWDREAGTRPSASTIQAGIKDYIARASERHDQGQLGPASWPEDKRVQATELLTGLDQWFQRQIEGDVARIQQQADDAVDVARQAAQTARHDLDQVLTRATAAEADAQAAHHAREAAEKQLVDAGARIEALGANVARLEAEVARLADTLEATRRQAQDDLEALRHAHQDKLEALQAEHRRELAAWQQDASRLEQLITAAEETIKRLRLDVQREVTAGEGLRQKLESALSAEKRLTEELKSAEIGFARVQDQLAPQERIVALMTEERTRHLQEIARQEQAARAAQQQLVDYLMSPKAGLVWSRTSDAAPVADTAVLPLPGRDGQPIAIVREQREDGGWVVYPVGQRGLAQAVPGGPEVGWAEVDALAWGVGLGVRGV